MKIRWNKIYILLVLCLIFVNYAYADKPFTVDDAINMVRVSNPQVSPDGDWIVYTKTQLNWKKNKRESYLWIVSSDGEESYKYTREEGDSSPQWSPDGQYLAFLRKKGDKRQVWVMRTQGGEAVPYTNHKSGVKSFHWGPDSQGIIFLADDIKSEKEKEKIEKGEDVIYVYEGPHGQYKRGSWSDLWRFSLKTKEEEKITQGKIRIMDYDVSPDGNRIVYIYRKENRRNASNLREMAVVDIGTGEVSRLTQNKAPEGNPRWGPKGNRIAYTAPDDKKWKLASSKIWVMEVQSREYEMVSEKFKGDIRNYRWSPDGESIIFNGGKKTTGNVYRLDVRSRDIEKLTHKQGVMWFESLSSDQEKAACVYSDNQTPPDIWMVQFEPYKEKRLTQANPWVQQRELAQMEKIQWKSKDGLSVEGLLYWPSDVSEKKDLPLILNIHGGPAGVFTNRFSPTYHIYASLGYVSLCPNVRGSRHYGDEFLRGNMGDIGGGDYWDLMTGVDRLIEEGTVDNKKMGVRGWSYGGILGGWTLTQTDRFKAAALGAMVSDWISEYGMGFNYDVRLWYIGGTPWENYEKYRDMSSLTHVENVQTPVMLFHGERDTTCTIGQSMNYFTYLYEMGKTVRFLRFPREHHGFREPRHQRIRKVEEIAWMQKHIREVDWKPQPREKEEKKEK
ncbi:S9 family peptidase [bacterium]|nr:S9 family peptidase [bacterium]